MCGFYGHYRQGDNHFDPQQLERALQQLTPRGPDAEGRYQTNGLLLGHRRLKIMDLSDGSAQPMVDDTLGLAMVFNGAIYNYPALRQELSALGYTFHSDGDTEVLLKAFHAWGPQMLPRLNGMFALAIYNLADNSLFLARDRLGIKPLYLKPEAGGLRFASTLPALLGKGEKPALSAKGLDFYLNFHGVTPAPDTVLEGIEKLPPGYWQRFGSEGTERQCWWQPDFDHKPVLSEAQWLDKLAHSLRGAVKRRNLAAVDVGILLSGGLDSSLITALVSEVHPKVQTFSVGFEGAGGEEGDEFRYSDLIAQQFGTEHHRIRVDEDTLLKELLPAISAMSEPMVSHDCIGFYLLSRHVARHCKVVQSGQGADEVFAGYHWYPPMQDTSAPVDCYRQHFFDRSIQEMQETLLSPWQQGDFAGDFVKSHFAMPGATLAIDKALRQDSQVMLVDDPVKRVDNMTMAFGLEARVPFLDHELVELAASMPPHLKVPGGGKYLLRQLGYQLLPNAVIDRPKGYFPVPKLKYIQGQVLALVKDTLYSDRAKARGLFNPRYLDRLFSAPEKALTPLGGNKLWQLASLELWMQAHDL
ncbi:N-acetylglutaminylglutamine amidotransferase [Gallaecimonas pentaromativorans]|uniref:N-acetylglutaminylglutamine amidotransferase n=1 Tax=Gallaecimonas pentaromativorans TaxID=584787 RepID=UPI003A93974E